MLRKRCNICFYHALLLNLVGKSFTFISPSHMILFSLCTV
ncbi:hypothetical protein HU200_057646 [Digitaria exilis]|uniref:Uncharacterized protein n=1 Tax=Digitaria exilis TaxID=1010633 RepID=A0A835AEL5_9POAL|nr:hypothetical protein HU200_057646 [Digitaria exilis]